ncbi:MAG: DUF1573 domain-containing protein [Phycisphaerae bacterium]
MAKRIALGTLWIALGAALVGCDNPGTADHAAAAKPAPKAKATADDSIAAAKRARPEASPPAPAASPQSEFTNRTTPTESPLPAPAAGEPSWRAESLVYDFGQVWAAPRNQVRHTFVFENAGGGTLKILEAKPKCGCTVAKNYTNEVRAGATGRMPITVRTRNLHGRVSKTIDVTTNDPKHPKVVLEMKGTVRTLCSLTPQNGSLFGPAKPAQSLFREVTIRSNVDYPLTLQLQPFPQTTFFEINFETVVPGKEWRYTASASAPLPEGANSTLLRFKTNSPDVPYYELYASCYVPPRVQVLPTKVVVTKAKQTEDRRIVRIINNGKTPFEIVSIMTSDPQLKPALLAPEPAKPEAQRIEVVLPPGYQPPIYGEVIQVKTTDAERSVIDIRVQRTFARPPPRPSDKPLKLVPGRP